MSLIFSSICVILISSIAIAVINCIIWSCLSRIRSRSNFVQSPETICRHISTHPFFATSHKFLHWGENPSTAFDWIHISLIKFGHWSHCRSCWIDNVSATEVWIGYWILNIWSINIPIHLHWGSSLCKRMKILLIVSFLQISSKVDITSRKTMSSSDLNSELWHNCELHSSNKWSVLMSRGICLGTLIIRWPIELDIILFHSSETILDDGRWTWRILIQISNSFGPFQLHPT